MSKLEELKQAADAARKALDEYERELRDDQDAVYLEYCRNHPDYRIYRVYIPLQAYVWSTSPEEAIEHGAECWAIEDGWVVAESVDSVSDEEWERDGLSYAPWDWKPPM